MSEQTNAEKRLASLEKQLARHLARETRQIQRREEARADPLRMFSNAARYKPMPIEWYVKKEELEKSIRVIRSFLIVDKRNKENQ